MREGVDVRFVSMFQFSTYISFDYNVLRFETKSIIKLHLFSYFSEF